MPVDTAKGHWQIDERNGIILDHHFVGNRFTSAFTVQTTLIVDSYWRKGKTMIAEFYSITANPVSTTGKGINDCLKVDSYGMRGYQRVVMRKVN